MSLKINASVAGSYAQMVFEGQRGVQGNGNAPGGHGQPVQVAAGNERPSDGLLVRTLKQIRREAGYSHASYLSGVVVTKGVNLNLDHSDEVDGGASTRSMDEGWVDVDFASDLGRPAGGSRDDAFAVRAQRTMAALENVSVDEVRAAYSVFVRGLPPDMGEPQRKDAMRTLLTETGGAGVMGTITEAIKAQLELQNCLVAISMRQDEPDRALITAVQRSILCTNALIDLVTAVAMATDAAPNQGAKLVEALDREMLSEDSRRRQETTETVARIFDEQLAGFNQLFDSMSAGGRVVTAAEFRQLESGLAKARKMLTDAQGGVVLKGGRGSGDVEIRDLDRELLRQLETRVGEMSSRVERLKVESLNLAAREIFDKFSLDLLESPLFDQKYADHFLDRYCADMDGDERRQTKKLVGDFRTRLENIGSILRDGLRSGRMDVQKAEAAFNELDALLDATNSSGTGNNYVITTYIENAQVDPGFQVDGRRLHVSPDWRRRFLTRFNDLDRVRMDMAGKVLLRRFGDMLKIFRGGGVPVVSGSLLAKVVDGTCGFSTAALSVAWGENGDSAMPGIDDRHLVSSKRLGSGACNTVKLCSYRQPDGAKQFRVFKPEIPARSSLEGMSPNAYDARQKVSTINVAVCRTAELLGIGNCVVGAHAGVHGGQFGLMMELAEGLAGESIGVAFKTGNADKRIGEKSVGELRDILNANGPEARKFLGNLRRAFADLDWLDHIVGQVDRHSGNYMISVGSDLSVTLKGIDNDMCFSTKEEPDSDGRDYPTAISSDTYERLERLVGEMNALDDEGVRQLLRRSLGLSGLTNRQLDRTAERIRNAWAQASSPEKCTVIRNEDDWGDPESMQRQVQRQASNAKKLDYFTRDVIHYDMFGRAGLTNNFIPALAGSESDRVRRERFACMQDVLNTGDDDLEAMIQGLNKGGQPLSVAEFRAYFIARAVDPLHAEESIDQWPEIITVDSVLSAMVEKCRQARNLLVEKLGAADIQLADDKLKLYVPLYFAGQFGAVYGESGRAEVFCREFAAISGHPAFAKPEIRNLFRYGGGFDWVSFVAECMDNVPTGVDEELVVAAFMTELAQPGFNLDQMDVARLRRLVVNKLTVEPRQVPGVPDSLGAENMAAFRRACATTPAGAEYYENVRRRYDGE